MEEEEKIINLIAIPLGNKHGPSWFRNGSWTPNNFNILANSEIHLLFPSEELEEIILKGA